MNRKQLQIYHRLPYPARCLAAGVRGWRLRRWRFGRETERLVGAALEREQWSAARWSQWRAERLAWVLHRAATRVPYYRTQWEQRRRCGERAAWERLENWPVLDKHSLRRDPLAFVADDCNPRRMFHVHTSGTSGTPLSLWRSRATSRAWSALFEARARRWYGVSRHDRYAHLGGQLVAAADRRAPPFWVWNSSLRQLYLSAYHLRPENVPAYLEAIRRHRVTYLLGYPSGLHALAQMALAQRLAAPRLRVAVGNAEPLFDHQRAAIEELFGCPVRETYGMAEIVCDASECAAGRLHVWPEVGWIEVLEDETDHPLESGRVGRLVCTGLLNADMPLIRYAVGDRGALDCSDAACACGRALPRLLRVEGRQDDVVVTPDGRRIGRLDPVFKADLPIREAQIVQESLDKIRVLVVPSDRFGAADQRDLIARLRDRLGSEMAIELETVPEIPRTQAGKFRAVVSRLPNVV
ncbi:MAG TPA: AMP-binding protein [Acidobacteriota bacterium]